MYNFEGEYATYNFNRRYLKKLENDLKGILNEEKLILTSNAGVVDDLSKKGSLLNLLSKRMGEIRKEIAREKQLSFNNIENRLSEIK